MKEILFSILVTLTIVFLILPIVMFILLGGKDIKDLKKMYILYYNSMKG